MCVMVLVTRWTCLAADLLNLNANGRKAIGEVIGKVFRTEIAFKRRSEPFSQLLCVKMEFRFL